MRATRLGIVFVAVAAVTALSSAETPTQKKRGYPEGQRGRIYSDDIQAVKREQTRASGGYRRDGDGKRPTTESAKLSRQAESIIEHRKLDKAIRELGDQIRNRNIEIASLSEPYTNSDQFFDLDSARSKLRRREESYQTALSKWNSVNPACTDGLTCKDCSCARGASYKALIGEQLDEASEQVDDAKLVIQATEEKIAAEQAERNRQRIEQRERLVNSQVEDEEKLTRLKESRSQLRLDVEGTKAPSTSGSRIRFDDSIPKK